MRIFLVAATTHAILPVYSTSLSGMGTSMYSLIISMFSTAYRFVALKGAKPMNNA
jgi:hypothetical protein